MSHALEQEFPNAAPALLKTLTQQTTLAAMLSPEQKDQLRATVARGLNDAQLSVFLERALATGLDPFDGSIWAKLVPTPNGGDDELVIGTGIAGLTRLAEQLDDYRGYVAGVVYEHDEFGIDTPDPESKSLQLRAGIVHRAKHPDKRGAVIGAWAVAEREDRPPFQFYCDVDDYAPPEGENWFWDNRLPVMIEKTVSSHVLRRLCGLGQIYLEEEVSSRSGIVTGRNRTLSIAPEVEAQAIAAYIMGLPAPLEDRETLARAVARCNELEPGKWGHAGLTMKLGTTGENIAAIRDEALRDVAELEAQGRSSNSTRPPEPAAAE